MTRYADLLKDVRWLARRGQIIARAGGVCEECGVDDQPWNALNVHHRYYRAGALPWEYEDSELVCLCRDCHEAITDELERAYRLIGRLPLAAFPQLVRAIEQLLTVQFPPRLPVMTDAEREANL